MSESRSTPEAALLGIGLDHADGHKRITQGESRGEKFAIVGGSEGTHERMTETVVKTFEDLANRGRRLAEAHPKELAELIAKNTPRP